MARAVGDPLNAGVAAARQGTPTFVLGLLGAGKPGPPAGATVDDQLRDRRLNSFTRGLGALQTAIAEKGTPLPSIRPLFLNRPRRQPEPRPDPLLDELLPSLGNPPR